MIARPCWIFDLDGTLTVAQHDFAAMKRNLGLPPEQTLLEAAAARQGEEHAQFMAAIDAWELEHADTAVARPGADALLAALAERGVALGVLTRNSAAHGAAHPGGGRPGAPLRPEAVAGRDSRRAEARARRPHLVAGRLGHTAQEAVMVGDFRFDLLAARAAGSLAVWLAAERAALDLADLADVVVRDLPELQRLAVTGG
ncbi:MAG: HAD family hydrolase [Myxococcota bacterium]